MNEALLSQLYLKDTAFRDLMQERIYNVLLIASTYDAFMMEEDGRVDEQIFLEYVSLNLSSPPRVTRVSNYDEALVALAEKSFDLIIAMPGVDISATFTTAGYIKDSYPGVPFVVLTPFSREVSRRLEGEDLSKVDYVFSWLGNVDLLVAIIKLIEDKMNARHDILDVGVQMILLVEDSVRFYSSILPTLYRYILQQSMRFSTEALNAHEAMMRMRGRPKVMLARDYEEAVELYDKYGDNILGVISDVAFMRDGAKNKHAGIDFAQHVRHHDPYVPIIIESSDPENEPLIHSFNGHFLDKNSKKLPVDLGQAISDNFGFGDFIIRDPKNCEEIMRITSLKDLQNKVFDIPAESLYYHAHRNDISRWLYSRALFPIAHVVKMHRFADISEAPAVRQLFFDLIVKYRKMKNRGVVAEFKKERFDKYSNFARIGQGSLGGKGRGLAFIDAIIKDNPVCDNFDGAVLRIPRTVVLCTDIFDEFMEINRLYKLALSDAPDEDILQAFISAKLPAGLLDDLRAIYDVIDTPIAVRSSSLLEDSHYQPFAGVYATYMIPHLASKERSVELLAQAVKAVYASVFYKQSKAYMTATSNVIDQEKMAVILQGVVGNEHGNLFYPSISGVARSLNYYPIGEERAEDGVAEIAIGLGKYIVDGGKALRVSPLHPTHVLQTSTVRLALTDTQTQFYALNTGAHDDCGIDESYDITTRNVNDAGKRGELTYLVSTYNVDNDYLIDSDQGCGRKVATFANVLKHNVFPLAKAMQFMLNTGAKQMGRPVEIEFACTLSSPSLMAKGDKGQIYWLQIRPMVDRSEMADDIINESDTANVLIKSTGALGHGTMDNIKNMVIVKDEAFSIENNWDIATEIEKINSNFTENDEGYILCGPGRWGSLDHALGIPVKWAQITAARLIVETSLAGRAIEPSQGSHFFQNLTSFGVGYFTVDPKQGDVLNTEALAQATQVLETRYIKVLRWEQPLRVSINGLQGTGVVVDGTHITKQEN